MSAHPERPKRLEIDDAMVDDILDMTDEEILAEVREAGKDPTKVAAHWRAIIERVTARYRN